jgi:hypothetical protein
MVPNMVDPGLIWGRVIAGLCFLKASQAPENGFIGTSELFRRNQGFPHAMQDRNSTLIVNGSPSLLVATTSS